MNRFNHLQAFKNITLRRTVILESATTTSAVSSGTSIDLSSRVRFLDTSVLEGMILLVRPRSKCMWRVNPRDNLFHRRR